MISVVSLLPPRGIWLWLLALAALSSPGLADQRITTRFEIFGFARIGVLTLRNRIEESGKRYTITTDYATKGIASVFVNLTAHAEVRGRLVPGSAQPEWFRNDSRRNGTERHSRLDYRSDGAIDAASTPPLPEPVPVAAMRGTVDNLTAYLRRERLRHDAALSGRHRGFGEGRGGSARNDLVRPAAAWRFAGSGADGNGYAARRGRGLSGRAARRGCRSHADA